MYYQIRDKGNIYAKKPKISLIDPWMPVYYMYTISAFSTGQQVNIAIRKATTMNHLLHQKLQAWPNTQRT